MQRTHTSRGFTLIELLVVIAIIALLSGVIFAITRSTKARARDTQRIANARQIALALEQYEHTTGTYRVAGAGYQGTGEGYVAKGGGGDYSTSLTSALKQQGYFSADTIQDPSFQDENYFLGMCSTTNAYALFLKVEQEDIKMASSTIRDACDGIQADTLGFNYIASVGGGGAALTAGAENGGAFSGGEPVGPTVDIAAPNPSYTFATSTVAFTWMWGVPNTQTTDSSPTLTWSAPINNSGSPITGYKIYRSTIAGAEELYQTIGNVVSYRDPFPMRGVTNYYKVAAINAVGEGAKSATLTVSGVPAPVGTVTTYGNTDADPMGMAFDGSNVYVANYTGNTISKVAPSGVVSQFTVTDGGPISLAYYSNHLHVTSSGRNFIHRYNMSGGYVNSYGTNAIPWGIAFNGNDACTANAGANNMNIVQIYSGSSTFTCPTGTGSRHIVSDMRNNLWITNNGSNTITRIGSGCSTTHVTVGSNPTGIVHDGSHLWVGSGSNTITKVSATTYAVLGTYSLPAGSSPYALTFDGTNVWVANYNGNSVSRVTQDGTITTFPGFTTPAGIVFDGTHIWVANHTTNTVAKMIIK